MLVEYFYLGFLATARNMCETFHIIVADDDSDDRLIISEAIRDYSNSILISEVSNGQELVELVKKQYESHIKPSAIILDINMPLLDGTDALKIIRSSGLADDVPVFILSTMRNKQRVQEALALGALTAKTKPNSMREFQQIINDICDNTLLK